MRPIKFRAWYMRTQSWIYFGIEGIPKEKENDIDYSLVHQFTGLLDKNGKEIYEGDILGTSISDCYAGPIFWDDKKAGFHTELDLPVSCIEVIGNIYEHKDLLN